MKFFLLLLICLCVFFCSCGHKSHTYTQSWSYDNEAHWKACEHSECDSTVAYANHAFVESFDGTLVCNVCAFSKTKESETLPHTHTISDEYVTSSTHHWRTCDDCNEKVNEQEHTWGENTVTVPPTSESDGVAERYCTVCGKFSSLTLPRMPEKMSEAEWRLAFSLLNVRVTELSKSGSLSSVDAIYDVDGKLVAQKDGANILYKNRAVLLNFDFSDQYDSFVHYGEGVYKSSGFHLESPDRNYNIQDVVVIFKNGTLENISYYLRLAAFGPVGYEYSFSNWGEITLEPEYFSSEILDSITSPDKFKCDFSLTYEKFDMSGKYIESQLTVTSETYICKNYQNSTFKGMSTGDSALVADGLSEHLYSLLSLFDPASFVYEEGYNDYTYVGDGENITGIGFVTSCDIYVSDGRLISISIQLDDGGAYYYDFQYH